MIPGLSTFGPAVRESVAAAGLDAEVEGIADGAAVSVDALFAMQARTELLGGPECSLIARPGIIEQNWDWHPDVTPLVWTVELDGRWFATLTEAGVVGKIGLSSAGLAIGLNFLRCTADGGLHGVPTHVLLRLLLERCDSVGDAVELLRRSRVSASSCITVASSGDAVAVELSPGGIRTLGGDPILHTNHFLGGVPAGEDLVAAEEPSTFLRLKALARLASLESPVVCRHDDPAAPWPDRLATLASVVMEPAVPRFLVADGPPCERPLREVPLP